LPASVKTAALAALSTLPYGGQICHGDFHPGNIMHTPGRAVVIDWIDASRGNPLADMARTTIIVMGAAASSEVPNPALKVIIRLFHSIYLHHYFQLRPCGEEEFRRWLPVVTAARLRENIPELEYWLLQQAEKVL
jgi:Ser/Thr protein kinase RdoA (MazF antagonist)